MQEQEEWRPVPGFHDYQVSSLGQVASIKRGGRQILAGGKTDTGYRNVLLYSHGQRFGRRVHALVALVFHGPRPEGLEIRHLDGDQLNNAAANLAYGTREENLEDQRRHRGLLLIVGPDPVPTWAERKTRLRRSELRTACGKGHRFTEANTYYYPNGRPTCRPCKSATEAASRRRRAFRAAGIEAAA
jgi:hypothetical protein